MKRVALIHTVPTVYETFSDRIREVISDVLITNTVDEYLASDPAERGSFTKNNARRLYSLIEAAAATGADAIVTTCSTLSPYVEQVRPFFDTPLVTIDGAMLREAVSLGTRIAVVATADSTVGPTTTTLLHEGELAGKRLELKTIVCPEAYTAVKARDVETHDRVVLQALDQAASFDVIVLAQASMAHLEDRVTAVTGRPAVSSPDRCIQELASVLATADSIGR